MSNQGNISNTDDIDKQIFMAIADYKYYGVPKRILGERHDDANFESHQPDSNQLASRIKQLIQSEVRKAVGKCLEHQQLIQSPEYKLKQHINQLTEASKEKES